MRNVLKSLVVASLLVSSIASAAVTADVTLGGTVDSTLALTSSSAGTNAATLAMAPIEQTMHVANMSMTTNNVQGLTLTATGTYALTNGGGGSIAFTVTSVEDLASATAATFSGAYSINESAAGTYAKDLYIRYTPSTTQDPGSYAGAITLTVSDN